MRVRSWVVSTGILAALVLACDGVTPRPDGGVIAPSSLRACGFDAGCDPGELCDISQGCGPAAPDGGGECGQVTGDLRCHRDCAADRTCATGEVCTTEFLLQRTDYAPDASYLCR